MYRVEIYLSVSQSAFLKLSSTFNKQSMWSLELCLEMPLS